MPPRVGNPAKRRKTFILDWRKFRDYSQETLGEMVGTTGKNISQIETGKQGYTQETLEAIADALGTHPGNLLTRPPTDADKGVVALPAKRRRA